MLAEFGEAFGFDLTWNGLALARSVGRRHIARASIGSIPFASAHFDVVTSFDVFQCLPDPVERDAAREMWRVLKPGGHAILNVAALEILSGGHAVLSEEVRRYTPQRLRSVFESAGFVVERLTFAHAALLPMMLPVRVWQRWRSRGTLRAGEFDITVPAAPVNGVLTALVGLEAAALRVTNMPIGSSLLLHARKPGSSA
jgi:SAM-dependent methyltransferase